jgi:hypothetical protein
MLPAVGYHRAMGRGLAFLVAGVVMFAAGSAIAWASPNDGAVTQRYVRADYELVHFAATRLGTGQALLEGVLYKTRALCPRAAAGSPQDPESTQLSNEVIGALVLADYRAVLPEINAFLRVAEHSSWSSRGLTAAVHRYARELRAISRLAPPDACRDVQSWAGSGFRTLPESTIRFDLRFIPNWVSLGVTPKGLNSFVLSHDRELLAGARRDEQRLSDFEANAVETWAATIDGLELKP